MEMMNVQIPTLKREWALEVDFETKIKPWTKVKEKRRKRPEDWKITLV